MTRDKMTESAFGKRQREMIKRIVGTNEDISWDVKKEDSKGATLFVSIGGKEAEPLTDMDWDMAINEPSRLMKRTGTPPHTQKLVRVKKNEQGYITQGKILNYKIKKMLGM